MNTRPVKLSPPRQYAQAFTLNELLIVIALMVIIMGLAVPAFNAISGSRSIESAENQISAFLAAVRSEAIGLQEPRGVLMFEDSSSGRVVLIQVFYPPNSKPNIDLFVGRDEMVLPGGVGLRGIPNQTQVVGGVTTVTAYSQWPNWTLVMFDGSGHVMLDTITIPSASNLATRVGTPAPSKLTPLPTNLLSNLGFILFDRAEFNAQPAANQTKWLADNATPFALNRYNGSLLRGE